MKLIYTYILMGTLTSMPLFSLVALTPTNLLHRDLELDLDPIDWLQDKFSADVSGMSKLVLNHILKHSLTVDLMDDLIEKLKVLIDAGEIECLDVRQAQRLIQNLKKMRAEDEINLIIKTDKGMRDYLMHKNYDELLMVLRVATKMKEARKEFSQNEDGFEWFIENVEMFLNKRLFKRLLDKQGVDLEWVRNELKSIGGDSVESLIWFLSYINKVLKPMRETAITLTKELLNYLLDKQGVDLEWVQNKLMSLGCDSVGSLVEFLSYIDKVLNRIKPINPMNEVIRLKKKAATMKKIAFLQLSLKEMIRNNLLRSTHSIPYP